MEKYKIHKIQFNFLVYQMASVAYGQTHITQILARKPLTSESHIILAATWKTNQQKYISVPLLLPVSFLPKQTQILRGPHPAVPPVNPDLWREQRKVQRKWQRVSSALCLKHCKWKLPEFTQIVSNVIPLQPDGEKIGISVMHEEVEKRCCLIFDETANVWYFDLLFKGRLN